MKQETLNSLYIDLAYLIFIGAVLAVAFYKPAPQPPADPTKEELKAELREKNERIRELRVERSVLIDSHDEVIAQFREENRLQAEEIQRLRDELAFARGNETPAPIAA